METAAAVPPDNRTMRSSRFRIVASAMCLRYVNVRSPPRCRVA